MDEDDQVKRSNVGPPDLSGWSVAELQAYIARLEVEMARARAEIESKNAVRSAAEALFKKS
ncbi:MAG: DUF1192 domain-containing protein [Alphaproteobacteria bacterium]